MKKLVCAISLVTFGIGLGMAWAAPARPMWSYHNGNTLIGHSADYRRGYYIGIIDGFLEGHRLREEKADDGRWLDNCLASGWTERHAAEIMEANFQKSVRGYANPAVTLVIDGLKKACAKN